MLRDAQIVAGVHIHDIEARAPGTQCCLAMPAAQVANVLLVHGARLYRTVVDDRPVRGRERHLARAMVRAGGALVHEFDGCQGPMLVHGIRHESEGGDIGIRPQPALV